MGRWRLLFFFSQRFREKCKDGWEQVMSVLCVWEGEMPMASGRVESKIIRVGLLIKMET